MILWVDWAVALGLGLIGYFDVFFYMVFFFGFFYSILMGFSVLGSEREIVGFFEVLVVELFLLYCFVKII